jgi:hypothetical protein
MYLFPYCINMCSSVRSDLFLLFQNISGTVFFVPMMFFLCSLVYDCLFPKYTGCVPQNAKFPFPNIQYMFLERNIFVPRVDKICSSEVIFVPLLYKYVFLCAE